MRHTSLTQIRCLIALARLAKCSEFRDSWNTNTKLFVVLLAAAAADCWWWSSW